MRKEKRSVLRRFCLLAGIGLLLVAVVVMCVWQRGIRASAQSMKTYVQTIRSVMPEPQDAVPEVRKDNTMSVFSLDDTDFIGLLELPRYGSSLPVCADWGAVSDYPCRLDGSVYDGTMQIGGTTQTGQYDFYRELSVGDRVYFTDMEGNRYTYIISDIRYEEHADQAALQREEAALTLFIKNIYALEYIVLFCNTPN